MIFPYYAREWLNQILALMQDLLINLIKDTKLICPRKLFVQENTYNNSGSFFLCKNDEHKDQSTETTTGGVL